jgi:mono/diheme cytochrome c family protein
MSSRKAGEETMRTSHFAVSMLWIMSVLTVAPVSAQNATFDVNAKSIKEVPRLADLITGRGHDLFLADGCSECHGTVGQGSRVAGPRLAPQTLPFEAFLQVLRHPISDMPPYVDKMLSDADARDIHAYLQSIPGPTHAVSDIPALNH